MNVINAEQPKCFTEHLPPASPDDCIAAIDRISGVVTLARNAVCRVGGRNEELNASWTALDAALDALWDLRNDLEAIPPGQRRDRLDGVEVMP